MWIKITEPLVFANVEIKGLSYLHYVLVDMFLNFSLDDDSETVKKL